MSAGSQSHERSRPEAAAAARDTAVLAAGFLAAVAIRILFLIGSRDHNNLVSWRIVVEVLERGGDFYRDTANRYNYSPVWAGVLWALAAIGRRVGFSLNQAVSLLLLAVDVATALLLFRIGWRRTGSRRWALAGSLLFFANPVSVIVSGMLGAFDSLAIFFLLLAIDFAEERPVRRAASVGAMCVSLLVKHVAWFHPILLLRRRREPRVGLLGALLPYALFLASFLPFWRFSEGIRESVFGYHSLDEPYGLEPLRFWPFLPPWTLTAIFLVASVGAAILLRGVEFGRACLLLFLVVLIFLPGVGENYFVWPIALGALYPGAGYAVYSLIVSLFLIHSPEALAVELPHLPGWSGPWWAAVFWLLWEVRQMRRPAPSVAASSG